MTVANAYIYALTLGKAMGIVNQYSKPEVRIQFAPTNRRGAEIAATMVSVINLSTKKYRYCKLIWTLGDVNKL